MATPNLADRCLDSVERLTRRISCHVTVELYEFSARYVACCLLVWSWQSIEVFHRVEWSDLTVDLHVYLHWCHLASILKTKYQCNISQCFWSWISLLLFSWPGHLMWLCLQSPWSTVQRFSSCLYRLELLCFLISFQCVVKLLSSKFSALLSIPSHPSCFHWFMWLCSQQKYKKYMLRRSWTQIMSAERLAYTEQVHMLGLRLYVHAKSGKALLLFTLNGRIARATDGGAGRSTNLLTGSWGESTSIFFWRGGLMCHSAGKKDGGVGVSIRLSDCEWHDSCRPHAWRDGSALG